MKRALWLVLVFAFTLGCASSHKIAANSRIWRTLNAVKGAAHVHLMINNNKAVCYEDEITAYPRNKPRMYIIFYYRDQSEPESCYSVYEDDGGVEIRYLPCADLPKEYCEAGLQRNNLELWKQKNSTP